MSRDGGTPDGGRSDVGQGDGARSANRGRQGNGAPIRIGFFVNGVETELKQYTTTLLAHAALTRGHEAWYIGAEDFSLDPDGRVFARACTPPAAEYESSDDFFRALQEEGERERVPVDALDVLLLRSDPARESGRPWAQSVGILFGRVAARRGVLVLNHPDGLARARNKIYLNRFPPEVRPVTLVSRDPDEIKEFVRSRGDHVVLKPVQGSGGESVFLVRQGEEANLNQMIEAVRQHGYVIVQEFVPEASERDTRLFLLNGEPLVHEGKYAAFQRVHVGGDLRTNMTAGGKARPAEITPEILELADVVRPPLVEDGMFLVGLDIAGGKIIEANVFSPGGLRSAGHFAGVDFSVPVLDALERKVMHQRRYGRALENVEVAKL